MNGGPAETQQALYFIELVTPDDRGNLQCEGLDHVLVSAGGPFVEHALSPVGWVGQHMVHVVQCPSVPLPSSQTLDRPFLTGPVSMLVH